MEHEDEAGTAGTLKTLQAQVRAEPTYIVVGTPGPEGWGSLHPMKAGTAAMMTVREDGSGYTTCQDGTVRQLTAEEVLVALADSTDGDEDA